jgi:hypothetical protein
MPENKSTTQDLHSDQPRGARMGQNHFHDAVMPCWHSQPRTPSAPRTHTPAARTTSVSTTTDCAGGGGRANSEGGREVRSENRALRARALSLSLSLSLYDGDLVEQPCGGP